MSEQPPCECADPDTEMNSDPLQQAAFGMQTHRYINGQRNGNAINREQENLHVDICPEDRLVTKGKVEPVLDEVIGNDIGDQEGEQNPNPEGKGSPKCAW